MKKLVTPIDDKETKTSVTSPIQPRNLFPLLAFMEKITKDQGKEKQAELYINDVDD